MSRAYFLSDLHLKTMQERNSQTLLRFLLLLKQDAEADHRKLLLTPDENLIPEPVRLFLVGDIFDLWIGNHAFFVKRFQQIVNVIAALVEAGVEVHYFEGNHDLYLNEFWTSIGVLVHENDETFQVGPLRVRVEHGDLINPDDKGYLFLRWFLRTSLMKWLARKLPGSLVSLIGERASSASRQYTSTTKEISDAHSRDLVRSHAKKVSEAGTDRGASANDFDLLISGHVHVKDDFSFNVGERNVRSINLGSWYDEPKVLVIENGRVEFKAIS